MEEIQWSQIINRSDVTLYDLISHETAVWQSFICENSKLCGSHEI